MLLVHSWEGLLAVWGIYPSSSTCLGDVEASDVWSHRPSFLFLLSLWSLLLAPLAQYAFLYKRRKSTVERGGAITPPC